MPSGGKSSQPVNRLGRPPGLGQGKGRTAPRGRQTDPGSIAEVRGMIGMNGTIGTAALETELLLEYLHQIQDAAGCLRHRHLALLDPLRHVE